MYVCDNALLLCKMPLYLYNLGNFQGHVSCDVYTRKCLADRCYLEYKGEKREYFFSQSSHVQGMKLAGISSVWSKHQEHLHSLLQINDKKVQDYKYLFCTIYECRYFCKVDICMDDQYAD